MGTPLKVASFTVHGTVEQSRRWKIAAEGEGFPSVGAWLAGAADAYLKIRARAGLPVPLAWRKGHFRVELETGPHGVPGSVSPPFGAFRGDVAGRGRRACHRYTLVYLPAGRILATVRTLRECRSLASELARLWYRGEGAEPSGNPAPALSVAPMRY